MSAGDTMQAKLLIAGVPFLISLGGALFAVESTAQATDEIEERVRVLEVKDAESGSTDVMVKQNTERLERLEAIVEKMADQQIMMLANQAAVCQKLDANCSR